MTRHIRYLKGKNQQNENVAQILCKKIYSFHNEQRPTYIQDEALFKFEHTPWRPGSQISLQANAYNPSTKSQNEFIVSLQGPNIGLSCQIMPVRVAKVTHYGLKMEQRPTNKITPIHMGYAFGGSPAGKTHPLNPIGSGYYLKGQCKEEVTHSLPLLEDPTQLLQVKDFFEEDISKLPTPIHFGNTPCTISSEPWWNVHPKLRSDTRFTNSCHFTLSNMHAKNPSLIVQMPSQSPTAWMDTAQGIQKGEMFIRDINIQVEENRMSVIWAWDAPFLHETVTYKHKISYGMFDDA